MNHNENHRISQTMRAVDSMFANYERSANSRAMTREEIIRAGGRFPENQKESKPTPTPAPRTHGSTSADVAPLTRAGRGLIQSLNALPSQISTSTRASGNFASRGLL